MVPAPTASAGRLFWGQKRESFQSGPGSERVGAPSRRQELRRKGGGDGGAEELAAGRWLFFSGGAPPSCRLQVRLVKPAHKVHATLLSG